MGVLPLGPDIQSLQPMMRRLLAIVLCCFVNTPAVWAQAPTSAVEPAKPSGYLQGRVSAGQSPFLQGSVETLPTDSKVTVTLLHNLNSELNQKGDEVFARIACNVEGGGKVLLPAGWHMHGIVTDVGGQKRLGRNGYVQIEFDKLVSPDGDIELPFKAQISTHDGLLKSVAKVAAIDAGYMTVGAFAGSLLSVQMTGIGTAIATEGISVGVGAGIGATIGLIGALKRKGKIASLYPGDEMQMTIAEPITLPGFNPALLAVAAPPKLSNLDLLINKSQFKKDPYDSHSRILLLDLVMDNRTQSEYSFFDLAVVSDHNQRYFPSVLGDFLALKKKVPAHTRQQSSIAFSVDSPQRKYWLVLLDKVHRQELTRVPIN